MQMANQCQRSGKFRGQRHQADVAARGALIALESGYAGGLNAVQALHADKFRVDIRAFHVDTDRFSTFGWRGLRDPFGGGGQAFAQEILRLGGRGRQPGRYPRLY